MLFKHHLYAEISVGRKVYTISSQWVPYVDVLVRLHFQFLLIIILRLLDSKNVISHQVFEDHIDWFVWSRILLVALELSLMVTSEIITKYEELDYLLRMPLIAHYLYIVDRSLIPFLMIPFSLTIIHCAFTKVHHKEIIKTIGKFVTGVIVVAKFSSHYNTFIWTHITFCILSTYLLQIIRNSFVLQDAYTKIKSLLLMFNIKYNLVIYHNSIASYDNPRISSFALESINRIVEVIRNTEIEPIMISNKSFLSHRGPSLKDALRLIYNSNRHFLDCMEDDDFTDTDDLSANLNLICQGMLRCNTFIGFLTTDYFDSDYCIIEYVVASLLQESGWPIKVRMHNIKEKQTKNQILKRIQDLKLPIHQVTDRSLIELRKI